MTDKFSSNHTITGIMAADPKGVVGLKNGDLPWHDPSETQHFRDTVRGHILVMGRKTFDATPVAILQECLPVVFSHSRSPLSTIPNMLVVSDIKNFLELVPTLPNKRIFMIGGAEIAHLFLEHNLIYDFMLTTMHEEYQGDIVLNLALFTHWPFIENAKTANYTIRTYTNPCHP